MGFAGESEQGGFGKRKFAGTRLLVLGVSIQRRAASAYTPLPMDPFLLDITTSAQEVIQQFTYLGPFVVLVLCGLGLPLPEEVTLIGSGIMVYQGQADFTLITITCSAAILIGDLIPFFMGRRYGKSVLEIPLVTRVLHPERFARLETRFLEHGNWATFICRFLPGIRIPGYFVAGTMGMKTWRFLISFLMNTAICLTGAALPPAGQDL